jgi:hypothetical protein
MNTNGRDARDTQFWTEWIKGRVKLEEWGVDGK